MIKRVMETAAGDAFTFSRLRRGSGAIYASKVAPFGETYPCIAAYFYRLIQRPSYARAVREAEPYLKFFPQ
jgi:glutathione S-transferase